VILWRLSPALPKAPPTDPGGPLWFPRELQGAGRHDAPDRYGCLYASEDPVSAVTEALAPFRGAGRLSAAMLLRSGRPLALARLELDGEAGLIDLDDPRVLSRVRLRPSGVATGVRTVTQGQAERLFEDHPKALGLRWWSTLEASLLNVTLFDRAAPLLRCTEVQGLTPDHPAVCEAAELLGLAFGVSA
jgi:hypothetical protein